MKLDKQFEFFSLLLEEYTSHKNKMTAEVLREWDSKGLTDKIYNSYENYRGRPREEVFKEIDALIAANS